MPIDFPSSPTPDQEYTYAYSGRTYIYKASGYWTIKSDSYANPFIRREFTWAYNQPGIGPIPGEAKEITYV